MMTDCYFVPYIKSADAFEILNRFFQLMKKQTPRVNVSRRSFELIFFEHVPYEINKQTKRASKSKQLLTLLGS